MTVTSLTALTAQNKLTGRITNTQGEPIIGANVVLTTQKGQRIGSASDKNGFYTLSTANEGTLTVSHLMYQTETVKNVKANSKNSQYNIQMKADETLLSEVTIMPTRASQNAPFAQSTVKKDQIQRENYGQNIPQLLQNQLSVVSTSDDGLGLGYSYMRVRGSDASRTNVTINNIALNDSESGAVFWVNMPDLASSAADINIQRGAGTSTNGSGAFGGSVNIRTTSPEEKLGAGLHYSVGSFGTQKFSGEFSSGLMQKHWELSGRLSRAYSDGYIDRASTSASSYFLSGGYYDRSTTVKILAFGGKQKTYQAWNGISAEQLKTDRRFNSCGAIYDASWEKVIGYYDNETDNYNQDHLQLLANHTMGRFTASMILHYTFGRGYYENYKQEAKLSRYGIDPVVIDGQTIKYADVIPQKWLYNHYYGGNFSLTYKDTKITSILSGAYSRYDGDHYGKVIWAQYTPNIPKDYHFYDNKSIKDDWNVFLKTEYTPIKALSLYLDLQYRGVQFSMNGTEDKGTILAFDHNYSFFNPKLGVNYQINESQRAYASYSRASKEPNRSDIKDSDIEIRAEYLDDFEIGYAFSSKNVNASANVYYMNYTGQLVPTGELNSTGYLIRENVEKSYRLGIEIAVDYTPVKW
ncbi:MAG: TonB-dependent receptor, partial [Flavobacteriales bacterium]|nr:TonB-dependent receptor [Flavobacteriales bacterium]